ncbi:MAG TPA: SusD/RagB family nutrient-binding outer membrane lipoprotein, partial [Flavitalea sp.]|nr:SusD/RagB family nutrient-binding outer membrane lipoprotein [Flavitalea sp.]
GTGFFPTITYAEYCLMRAEFIERGITGGSAEEWYNKGIEASLRFYDARAAAAMLPDYTPLTDGEISDYLATPDVKYDASKGLEQIITQAYLNFFKQPNEAWANYKRTGMPNSSTALANETITIDGTARAIPRRAQLTAPAETDQNFDTKTAALQEMATDPAFGQGPGDGFGRTWWDVE